jgi:hypothetical protein
MALEEFVRKTIGANKVSVSLWYGAVDRSICTREGMYILLDRTRDGRGHALVVRYGNNIGFDRMFTCDHLYDLLATISLPRVVWRHEIIDSDDLGVDEDEYRSNYDDGSYVYGKTFAMVEDHKSSNGVGSTPKLLVDIDIEFEYAPPGGHRLELNGRVCTWMAAAPDDCPDIKEVVRRVLAVISAKAFYFYGHVESCEVVEASDKVVEASDKVVEASDKVNENTRSYEFHVLRQRG